MARPLGGRVTPAQHKARKAALRAAAVRLYGPPDRPDWQPSPSDELVLARIVGELEGAWDAGFAAAAPAAEQRFRREYHCAIEGLQQAINARRAVVPKPNE